MRKEICYVTDDGSIFLDPHTARRHEVGTARRHKVGMALREIYGSCPLKTEHGSIVHVDQVVHWVTLHSEELGTILQLKE